MKIYAAADLHGHPDRIDTIGSVSQRIRPDLIILAGDITQYRHQARPLAQLSSLPWPIFCVRGNSDFKSCEKQIKQKKNMSLLTEKGVFHKGFVFKGVNGTLPLPFASRICLGESKVLKNLAPMSQEETILVSHCPPRGILDKVGNKFCAGSQNLGKWIKTHPPRLLICGHIHEQSGWNFSHQTLVINCAMGPNNAGVIIELKENSSIGIRPLKHKDDNGIETRLEV